MSRALEVRSGRRQAPQPGAVESWTREDLQKSSDPMSRGVLMLQSAGISHVLFLTLQISAGSQLPLFAARAAIAAPEYRALWRGVRWNPILTPEVWNDFVRNGIVELAPQSPHGSLLRAAFGAKGDQWLTLVRVGGANSTRGVLVFISIASKRDAVEKAHSLLSAPPQKHAA